MPNYDLSYNEARRIQRAQLAYYRQYLGRKGTLIIQRKTKPCPPGIHPDIPISIFKINELIPRGGDIENVVNYMVRVRGGLLAQIDQTNSAWHDAIRKGLF